MQNHANVGTGCAPEVGQAMVRRQLEEQRQSGVTQPKAPERTFMDDHYWYLDEHSKPVGPVLGSELQTVLNKFKNNLKACKSGTQEWLDATDFGFTVPKPEEEDHLLRSTPTHSGGVAQPKNQFEEKLETLPDSDLIEMAISHNVIARPDQYDRSTAVKKLGELQVPI